MAQGPVGFQERMVVRLMEKKHFWCATLLGSAATWAIIYFLHLGVWGAVGLGCTVGVLVGLL